MSIHPVIYLDDLILIEKTVKEILISKNKLIFSLSASGFCYISKNVGSRQDIYHEITLKIFEIFVNFNKNSKTWFFTFLNIYVSLMDLDKILIIQNSITPLFLGVQFQTNPHPNDNQQIKRKHNPGMTIMCY